MRLPDTPNVLIKRRAAGMPETQILLGEDFVVKRHEDREALGRELEFLRVAESRGVGPRILQVTDSSIVMARHMPLADLYPFLSHAQLAVLADDLRTRLAALHRAGVCHRDVYLGNILVTREYVCLLVDFELATRVDPAMTCYDMHGPTSGVPLPEVHAQLGPSEGVWWAGWTGVKRPADLWGVS